MKKISTLSLLEHNWMRNYETKYIYAHTHHPQIIIFMESWVLFN